MAKRGSKKAEIPLVCALSMCGGVLAFIVPLTIVTSMEVASYTVTVILALFGVYNIFYKTTPQRIVERWQAFPAHIHWTLLVLFTTILGLSVFSIFSGFRPRLIWEDRNKKH